jgi:F1F0 ATPase subunit 2
MPSGTHITGFIIGVIVGLYYFYGLWLTVQKVPSSPNPKRLLGISLIIRLIPVLLIIFLAVRYNLGMFFSLLAGFFLVRFIMTKKITNNTKEEIHAAHS